MLFGRFQILVIILLFSFTTIFGQSTIKDSLDYYHFTKGENLLGSSKLDSAFFHFEKAATIAKEYKNWRNYINSLNGKAFYYYSKGDYTAAEKEMIVAEKEAIKYLEPNDEIYSSVLNNLGAILGNKGHFERALEYSKKSIEIDELSNPDKLSKATSFQNISIAYRNIGDYDQGILYEQKALQLRMDSLGPYNSPVASSHIALGHLYRDKNEIKRALNTYLEALDIIKKASAIHKHNSHDLIYCYQSLSEIFINQKDFPKALEFINKAFSLQNDPLAPRKIQSFEILGDWYAKQGKYKEAIDNHLKSKDYLFQLFEENEKNSLKARVLKNIASTYLLNDNIEKSIAYYQKALINLSIDFENVDIFSNPRLDQFLSKYEGLDIISGKSEAFLKRYNLQNNPADLTAAFSNFQFASEIIQELRNSFQTSGSKNVLAEKSLSIYEGGIKTAFLLYQKTQKKEYLEAAWNFAELNKGRLLEESLKENYAKIAGGLPSEDLHKEQNLRREIDFYKKQINQAKRRTEYTNQELVKKWKAILFDLTNEYNILIDRFEKSYPKYFALKYAPKNNKIKKIRSAVLTNQNALLEYFVGEDNIYLFCLTKKDLSIFEINKKETFADNITKIRSIVSASPFSDMPQFGENRSQFVNRSHQIYQQLLAPALSNLPNSIESLIIVPDDILAYLPFELLLTSPAKEGSFDYSTNSCSYLFEKYALSYNYSASLLAEHSDWIPKDNLNPFLGFAPSFGQKKSTASRTCSEDNIYSLQCNEKEVTSINDLLDGNTLTGSQANIESFNSMSKDCQILHLATHACIDEENADLNKIYFTDHYITGIDLNNLKLNAELAVLSACNTGSGKLIKGEGVMSLSRSFILAGCPSTLMSLWSVDDCTTSNIMVQFYEGLIEGLPKDEALKNAKLKHLSTADKVTSHPYYWAAFVQSGSTSPIQQSGLSFNYWWLLGLLLIPIMFFFRSKTYSK